MLVSHVSHTLLLFVQDYHAQHGRPARLISNGKAAITRGPVRLPVSADQPCPDSHLALPGGGLVQVRNCHRLPLGQAPLQHRLIPGS